MLKTLMIDAFPGNSEPKGVHDSIARKNNPKETAKGGGFPWATQTRTAIKPNCVLGH